MQVDKGTVNNANSSSSPGDSHSGRPRTIRTDQNKQALKAVLDRDAQKRIGDAMVSPVNTARLNTLAFSKSSFSRLVQDLKYHPYKALRRHKLQAGDPQRRLNFCHWLVQLPDAEIPQILSSAVQCFAGYYHMTYGHILNVDYNNGVKINTCKEFGLYHPRKGNHLIRASLPPS